MDYWANDSTQGRNTAEITRRLLASPMRGMTAGFPCPTCGDDGIWNWADDRVFECNKDGTKVDSYTGERI